MSVTTILAALSNMMIDATQGKASVIEILLLLTVFVVTVGLFSTAFGVIVTVVNDMASTAGKTRAERQRIERRWNR